LEVQLCLKETAPDLHGEVVRVQGEGLVEGGVVPAGCEAQALELAPAGDASAPIAELDYPIKLVHPAII